MKPDMNSSSRICPGTRKAGSASAAAQALAFGVPQITVPGRRRWARARARDGMLLSGTVPVRTGGLPRGSGSRAAGPDPGSRRWQEAQRQGETMAQQKRGLGKGLGALIPTGPVPGGRGRPPARPDRALSRWARVPVSRARRPVPLPGPTSRRCRSGRSPPTRASPGRYFDEEALDELVDFDPRGRAAAAGRGPRGRMPGRFELVMGERRWRASQRAGLTEIPAIVRATRG